jgi:hypothetical protein
MLTEAIRAGRGSIAYGKSSLPGGSRSQHDGERLPRGPSAGSPKVRVLCPLCAIRSRAGEDAGEVPQASSDYDEFLLGVGRQRTQRFLPSVIQNERDCLTKVSQAFFARSSLAVGAGHFSAIRDVPRAILLDNRRELVMHASILPPVAPTLAARLRRLPHHAFISLRDNIFTAEPPRRGDKRRETPSGFRRIVFTELSLSLRARLALAKE